MNNLKKWLSLCLAAIMALGMMIGCSNTEQTAASETPTAAETAAAEEPAATEAAGETATEEGTEASNILRWGTNSEPTGFDPHTNSEEASLRVMNQLYETLVSYNEDMTFRGELAESWEIPDETTYVFHLRQNVKFHSGRDMTAEDVVYTFDRVLGKTDAGDIGALGSKDSYYGGVASVTALDDYTVEFKLNAPNAAFLNNLTSNYGAIVDKEVIAENGDLMRADGGTGPFALGEWLPDNYVTLTKFEDYWDADRVKLDGITYYLIGDEAARLAALRTGEIDLASLSATNVTAAQSEENLNVISYQTNDYIALGCNLSTEALQDIRVRQAMSYAMDRASIINVVFAGQAAACSMVPPSMGHWSLDISDMPLFNTDIAKAQQLMQEAGYSETNRLTLKVAAGLLDSVRQTAVVLQQQFAEIYIDLEITNLESGEYVDKWCIMNTPEAEFDLMVVNDGAGSDPNRAIAFFYATDAGANVWGYSNERVDELCELGISTTDEAKREEYYNEAQLLCIDDCAKICICSPMEYVVTSSRLQGYVPTAANASDFRDAYFAD